MLSVDLRELHRGPVETVGQLSPDDPTFAGLPLELDGPLSVQGRLQRTGDDDFFWRATLSGRLRGACRRCLKELTYPLDADIDVLFSADVREAVREELALAVEAFPLCREDCAGLCSICGADLNAGPCGCTRSADQL
jgi:uncharacterized protein